MDDIVEIAPGSSPVILAFPHVGTYVPPAIRNRLNTRGQLLEDTDWHIDRLYADLLPEATCVRATHHRYVIDVNRDPTGISLYPGQNTTELVPTTNFDGEAIWRLGEAPDGSDIAARLDAYHRPYHDALQAQIERVIATHGVAVVYDCHSIRSTIPFLFPGRLPSLSIGTAMGTSCAPEIEQAAVAVAARAEGYSHVLNGRFKGGWTTRHYGRPQEGIHAIQMELGQITYLASEAPPFAYAPARADRLRPHLRTLLQRLHNVAFELRA